MKIPNRREIRKIDYNHYADINLKYFEKLYRHWT